MGLVIVILYFFVLFFTGPMLNIKPKDKLVKKLSVGRANPFKVSFLLMYNICVFCLISCLKNNNNSGVL